MSIGLRALVVGMVFASVGSAALAQPAAPSAPPATPPGDVVVEPTIERPKPPDGDPRSQEQRRDDRMAFEKCLLRRQGASGETLSSPGLPPDPVFACQQAMGMRSANDVPLRTRAGQR